MVAGFRGGDAVGEKIEISSLGAGLGRGVSLAALGGYRSLAANLVWVGMYAEWSHRRLEETRRGIELAVALNPDLTFFWIDGARIIANDMPVWEIGEERMNDLFETPEGNAIRYRYARRALAFLDQAPTDLQGSFSILKERGVIHWKRLDDLDGAIGYLRQAMLTPEPPYYLGRVCAELMVKQGRLREALDFLVGYYATLPDNDPRALKPLVAKRIHELQRSLESAP